MVVAMVHPGVVVTPETLVGGVLVVGGALVVGGGAALGLPPGVVDQDPLQVRQHNYVLCIQTTNPVYNFAIFSVNNVLDLC